MLLECFKTGLAEEHKRKMIFKLTFLGCNYTIRVSFAFLVSLYLLNSK